MPVSTQGLFIGVIINNKQFRAWKKKQRKNRQKIARQKDLEWFWKRVNTVDRLWLLKKMSTVKIYNNTNYNIRVEEFKKIKTLRRKPCFVCKAKSDARHHVVLLKNGGCNSSDNLVYLCCECHACVHPWLRG